MNRSENGIGTRKFRCGVNPSYSTYAKGTQNHNSDIDIAVVINRIERDYLEEQVKRFKLRRQVDLRIGSILSLSNRDDSDFLAEVMATGETVYGSPGL